MMAAIFFTYDELKSNACNNTAKYSFKYKFLSYMSHSKASALSLYKDSFLIADCPLNLLVPRLTVVDLLDLYQSLTVYATKPNSSTNTYFDSFSAMNNPCSHCGFGDNAQYW